MVAIARPYSGTEHHPMNRRTRTFLAAASLLGAALAVPHAASAESVAFGTDWKAEAEHGGFYQAIATGIYQRYGFSVAPFLADPKAIQQGYLTSEPFIIEKEGVHPVVLLLADAGYGSYGALIETSEKLVREKPDLVQRFVDASIEGWSSYLNGDPAPGNALIKRDNPEMTDALLAYGRDKMKEYGIVDSGDTKQNGIGAMSEARWRDFFDTTTKAGLYPAEMDFRKAYTLQFVNKKVGLASGSK